MLHANGGFESISHMSKGPFTLALGTFLSFLGMTLSFYLLPLGVVLLIIALLIWGKENLTKKFSLEGLKTAAWPFIEISNMKLGVWIFLFGEVLLFSSLLGSYLFIRAQIPNWPTLGEIFDIKIASINTFLLITSSFTAMLALNSIRRGEREGLKVGLIITLALGFLFLINKGVEWEELIKQGLTPNSSLPGTIFFTITGIHAAHVFAGLMVLIYLLLRSESFSKEKYESVEYFDLYWNFVDIVWLFIFPLLYLI
ncbi:Cytochrome c oxidase subunit 3 [archaeon HR06]|nr:Cytochrome c oxidase subunit 3 [archaeon HR06]